jgi:Uma2 family endonuclease
MNIQATKERYTPDDLLSMPDGDRYELVSGELVERHTGWDAGQVSARLLFLLSAHCDATGAGWVVGVKAGYQGFPDSPDKVRRPNGSFVRLERLPPEQMPDGHCLIAPDLAVEVIFPDDRFYEVENRVTDYLRAGVPLVWVVSPPTRTVRVHRADGGAAYLHESDDLTGDDVLPGFRCRVAALFAAPTPPSSP